jgi:hypothetical protein
MNTAQVLQNVGQTEMRVGMHSPEFGAISISTTLSHQELATQILVDHSGLGDVLATHLASMQEKLGAAYGVQARVEIRDSGTQFQSGAAPQQETGSGSSQPQHRGGASAPSRAATGHAIAPAAVETSPSAPPAGASSGSGRLSIRI